MASFYNQDEVLDWYNVYMNASDDLTLLDEECMYVTERKIYLNHTDPDGDLAPNDWRAYKNFGLEDIAYPNYMDILEEDYNGVLINYNQLLSKYETAISCGISFFYGCVGVVHELCELLNQINETVTTDSATQSNSPQSSFNSIIDYSAYASDEELANEQEIKQAKRKHSLMDKHVSFEKKWQPSEQEWNKFREIHKSTCATFIGEDDDSMLFGDALCSDGVPSMFESDQDGKDASSRLLYNSGNGSANFKDVLNENTAENTHDNSHGKSSEEHTISRPESQTNKALSHAESRNAISQNGTSHRVNARSFSISGTFQGSLHFQPRQRTPIFDYDDLCNSGSRFQGALFGKIKSMKCYQGSDSNVSSVEEEANQQNDV